jgi:hypothetical protein
MYAATKTIEPIAVAAQDSKTDWIIENAKIITLDARAPRAQAMPSHGPIPSRMKDEVFLYFAYGTSSLIRSHVA